MIAIDTAIAVNRFGQGARPGDLARVDADARGWLVEQLEGAWPLAAELVGLPDSATLIADIRARFEQRRRAAASSRTAGEADAMKALTEELDARTRQTYERQVTARMRAAVDTGTPFTERLAHFWTNHFATSADKATTRTLVATLEAEAVRPHVGGRFVDMLKAVEQHPAMLAYLDNYQSVGPGSEAARRVRRTGRRSPGINENLAREILELHTLGVDGGYDQADVTAFAHVLTGWTVGGLLRHSGGGSPGRFVFDAAMHEPGGKKLLGKRYPDDGHGQGIAVLEDLARHPSTARHVARKLARHFIADDPPEPAVVRIASAFADSEGHLPAVYRALVDSPEAWEPEQRKVKSPEEYVVSIYRALAYTPTSRRHTLVPMRLLGQTPYVPGSPAGWPDTAGEWLGPDALLKRVEWATAVGDRAGSRVDPMRLGDDILGPFLSARTRTSVSRASSPAQALTLLLASPEFQRR